ncbi:hypothetical protein REC12_04965 [Desulfosporosinus sp. PR]|uniref:hypothetical protein n=1 Tax=Candidatus Desulfosporosinus nitrosoreducens TaxID=3401928 RepID=UPI0027FD5836|nr:hypothetical protein [Desulfosporosinus sp. PR]MDQ7092931.1 hypothetical protein [Desulfosporosinus sp. PR]
MAKIIAVEIDDVLNNFASMMNEMGIIYDARLHSIADPLLKKCLYKLEEGGLTPTAEKVMESAVARDDSVVFLRWLSERGWTIILFTYRDLRFAYDQTIKWLNDHQIQYDYLFSVDNIINFCQDMKIQCLISAQPFQVANLTVFSPAGSDKKNLRDGLYEFYYFEEVGQWIEKL